MELSFYTVNKAREAGLTNFELENFVKESKSFSCPHANVYQLTKWKYLVDIYNEGDRIFARSFKTKKEALAFCHIFTSEVKYFRGSEFVGYI